MVTPYRARLRVVFEVDAQVEMKAGTAARTRRHSGQGKIAAGRRTTATLRDALLRELLTDTEAGKAWLAAQSGQALRDAVNRMELEAEAIVNGFLRLQETEVSSSQASLAPGNPYDLEYALGELYQAFSSATSVDVRTVEIELVEP
jgi:hypothetical protein